MAKRGRPVDPNAKRDSIKLRISSEEADMLNRMSKETGRLRSDILLEGVRAEIARKGGDI